MSTPIITEESPPSPAIIDERGLSASRQWKVLASSEINAFEILQSQRGVYYGVAYTDPYGNVPDPRVICRSLSASGRTAAPVSGLGLYTVTANYSRNATGGGEPIRPQPGGRAVWRVERSSDSVARDHDAFGFKIENVVEEPITGITALRGREILIAEWYVAGYDPIAAYIPYRPYMDKLNAQTWFGAPRGCVYFHGVSPTLETNNQIHMVARWEYRPPKSPAGISAFITPGVNAYGWVSINPPIPGWYDITPNQGKRVLVASDQLAPKNRYRDILDDRGQKIADPQNLTLDGLAADGLTDANGNLAAGHTSSDASVYALVFVNYEFADFNQIVIP